MLDLNTFVARYGEHGVQSLLETWERYKGIRHITPVPLEQRWGVFMDETAEPVPLAA